MPKSRKLPVRAKDGLYEMHRDVAEESIWKLKCYDRRYAEMFKRRYGPIFSKDALYRFVLGVRADKENVLARPLSKPINDLQDDMNIEL